MTDETLFVEESTPGEVSDAELDYLLAHLTVAQVEAIAIHSIQYQVMRLDLSKIEAMSGHYDSEKVSAKCYIELLEHIGNVAREAINR